MSRANIALLLIVIEKKIFFEKKKKFILSKKKYYGLLQNKTKVLCLYITTELEGVILVVHRMLILTA